MKILIAWLAPFVGVEGGMERVFANFANEMCNRGHDVTLLYWSNHDGKIYYPVCSGVKKINLRKHVPNGDLNGGGQKRKSLWFKFKREFLRIADRKAMEILNIKKEFKNFVPKVLMEENADIIIAMNARTASVLQVCLGNYGPSLVIMSHQDGETVLKGLSVLEKEVLGKSDALQVLMPNDAVLFKRFFPRTPIAHIPNAVPQYELSLNQTKEPLVVDVARIEKNAKRQHLLIEAFVSVASEFPDWQLELWGEEQTDGRPYTKELEDLIHKYHLKERVNLCGNTDDVLSVYQRASIFAFPSAFEGFGLAMTEAMSAGLPVVAYKSCPAVNELVKDGKTGLLVDDGTDALAEGLRKLMKDQELRGKMGRAAHEEMKAYAPEKIWDQWEALMKETVERHHLKGNQ